MPDEPAPPIQRFRRIRRRQADIARVEKLWSSARGRYGEGGPFLFGAYSAVDAFYTPLASRLATYDMPMSAEAQAYVDALHRVPAFRR